MDRPMARARRTIEADAHAGHDAANAATGFRFVRAIAVEKAALDRRLKPACIRVLAAISYFMNERTKRAWPSYRAIAEVTGCSEDTIDRSIRELKGAGYLFTERRSPLTGGRALVHYGLGAIHPADIEEMIAAAVGELRRREQSNSHSDQNSGVAPDLTPLKKSGSARDPAVSDASDPAVLSPQEPSSDEPLSEERNDLSLGCIVEGEIVDAHQSKRRKGRPLASQPHHLPEDWTPGPDGLAYAIDRGLSDQIIRREWENFREHHIGKKTKWARWDLAWQKWVRNTVEWRGARSSRGRASTDDLAAQAFGGNPWERS